MTFPNGSTRTLESGAACAAQRLAQISRLVQLPNEVPEEFSAAGLKLVRRAIFAMVLDCRQAGLTPQAIRRALNGEGVAGTAPDGESDAPPDFPLAA